MALPDLTDSAAVHRALSEFDALGRDAFLAQYGFGKSRSYFLIANGRSYDSKAIAGVAHGHQHPQRGFLKPSDFSGGDATVRARLEALGFTVVVTEPRSTPERSLVLFEDYSRRDVHDMFAPQTAFTPGAGLWGMQGIIEHRLGEFIVFVTFGREQGEHKFDEGITDTGVLTWQSQPNQTLASPQVGQLIAHDAERRNIHLFLRTRERGQAGAIAPYTYLGRLSYITHDVERERPVWFQWQLIDTWPPSQQVLDRMGLLLTSLSQVQQAAEAELGAPSPPPGLTETALPKGTATRGKSTPQFRARKSSDRSAQDAKNRALGLAGELAVVAHEQQRLVNGGREDLAALVRHVAATEGDGAGYDVLSFELDGIDRFIEVKTTRDGIETDFYISANEVDFSTREAAKYWLCRVYDFDTAVSRGSFYLRRGSLVNEPTLQLEAVMFKARAVNRP
jgi:hypothetical protein